MILRSVESRPTEATEEKRLVPAWEAVFRAQQQRASGYWLIAQPDHAALAGDLAEEFTRGPYPHLEEDAVRAFRLHDAGWAPLDGGSERGVGTGSARPRPEPRRSPDGRPLSFLEFGPRDFLPAWNGSIERAEQASGAVGGLLVGEHFVRLARTRLDSVRDSEEESCLTRRFLEEQAALQAKWIASAGSGMTRERVQALTDVLQFCDLLSLYLCCGSEEDVSFPQAFAGQRPVLRRRDGTCRLEPSPFSDKVVAGITARLDRTNTEKTFELVLR